jgi:ribosomal protein L22
MINGWKLQRAQTFLQNVCEKKEDVAMRRFCGSIGRAAQGTTRQHEPLVRSHGVWDIWNWGEPAERTSTAGLGATERLGHDMKEWC